MRKTWVWWTALPVILCCPGQAGAQVVEPPPAPLSDSSTTPAETIEFSADEVTYTNETEQLTAAGKVRMSREGNYLAADQVTWDRKTGKVLAQGNVVVVNPQGDKLVGESVDLTDTLRDGTVQNLLLVLETGGRIAAASGTRTGDVITLRNAIYSACAVTTNTGCPKRPSWSISAAQVVHDSSTGKVRFRGGRLQLLGISLPLLPIFGVNTGKDSGGATGVLVPDVSISSHKGLEVAVPYYWRIAPNQDLTVTPHLYTHVWPGMELKYRQLNSLGAFQLGAFVTYSRIESADLESDKYDGRGFRGYFEGNGKVQLDPLWSITGAFRVATDKTVTRRYDITRDDRLRSFINAERIDTDSYVSIAGWAFQGLRVDDVEKRIPIALPAIDARFRLDDPISDGTIEIQGNSLSILRLEGQDTQRAFGSVRWDLRRLTPMGQELTLTAYARGDLYHTNNSARTDVALYRGEDGWHARGIGALAADMRWPLIGAAFGGIQRVTPRVQLVLTPPTKNLVIPNEDARAVDLEDSNLFALNRFPGYDRWEDGSRVTYGLEYALDRPNLSISTVVGQSYRLTRDPSIFPEGTGLTDRLSDIVGRTRIRYGRLIDITHRFRVDKDNLAVRRNELDLTLGSTQTYVQIGYLRLDRNIDESIEDLRDKEELRVAGRIKFARYWSIFGATVVDLTGQREDPLSLADGYEPVRNRLGILYEDDCLQLGVSWRRDYERIGTFRKGSTFSISFGLKGLGR
ncbi:MAG: LPS-assembly protein LptD [Sphingomicrobium sp.]